MTVVVDIGCHNHPRHEGRSQDSVARLIARFRPHQLFGFDPHPDMPELAGWGSGMTTILVERKAAWTHDGLIGYTAREDLPLRSKVGGGEGTLVPCFDLSAWLAGRRVVLKIDAEGAEYELLEHLHATGRDWNVERLLVEWHSPPQGPPDWEARRDRLIDVLRCPVEVWES